MRDRQIVIDRNDAEPERDRVKKPYRSPCVVEYGPIAQLTGMGATGKKKDAVKKKRR